MKERPAELAAPRGRHVALGTEAGETVPLVIALSVSKSSSASVVRSIWSMRMPARSMLVHRVSSSFQSWHAATAVFLALPTCAAVTRGDGDASLLIVAVPYEPRDALCTSLRLDVEGGRGRLTGDLVMAIGVEWCGPGPDSLLRVVWKLLLADRRIDCRALDISPEKLREGAALPGALLVEARFSARGSAPEGDGEISSAVFAASPSAEPELERGERAKLELVLPVLRGGSDAGVLVCGRALPPLRLFVVPGPTSSEDVEFERQSCGAMGHTSVGTRGDRLVLALVGLLVASASSFQFIAGIGQTMSS